MLIIDDGYPRQKLNVPGVAHTACGARWSQERGGDTSTAGCPSSSANAAPGSTSPPLGRPCGSAVGTP
eukprot:10054686-Alexandrium_andersonii.AAC.1